MEQSLACQQPLRIFYPFHHPLPVITDSKYASPLRIL